MKATAARDRPARILLGAVLGGCAAEVPEIVQARTDTWELVATDEVDILFVVDDSSSMGDEQERLAEGFGAFADELEGAGAVFHLGVIGTTLQGYDAEAPLVGEPPFLTPEDADLRGALADRARLGLDGSDQERGLAAALLALEAAGPGGAHEGFLREGSAVWIVFVSDEDDCSHDGGLEGLPAMACYEPTSPLVPVAQWSSDLIRAVGPGDRIRIAAIAAPAEPVCQAVYPGLRYREAAAISDGAAGDPCEEDWSEMLGSLGRLAAGIRTRFPLSLAARPETLVVRVDEVEVPRSRWRYEIDTWTVELDRDAAPPRGATVSATYTVDPSRSIPYGRME